MCCTIRITFLQFISYRLLITVAIFNYLFIFQYFSSCMEFVFQKSVYILCSKKISMSLHNFLLSLLLLATYFFCFLCIVCVLTRTCSLCIAHIFGQKSFDTHTFSLCFLVSQNLYFSIMLDCLN